VGAETSVYNFVLEGGRKKTFVSYEQRLVNMVVNDGAESDPPSDDEGSNSKVTHVTGPLIEVHDSDSEPEMTTIKQMCPFGHQCEIRRWKRDRQDSKPNKP
jgi:hypothetical protein